MRSQKKATAASRAAWRLAVDEGRVVRIAYDDRFGHEQSQFTAHPTRDMAARALDEALRNGERANLVTRA